MLFGINSTSNEVKIAQSEAELAISICFASAIDP